MGWRDINMNRRKPQLRFAVVPNEEGLDPQHAVLRKAVKDAATAAAQCGGPEGLPTQPALLAFAAGYIAGFARHQALRHGVDAEQDMRPLLATLAAAAPEGLKPGVRSLAFARRTVATARAGLAASGGIADAGYLTGLLESLCASRKLLGLADQLWGPPDAAELYLNACDTAADRMQTHLPTSSLRFDQAERAVIRSAFTLSAE